MKHITAPLTYEAISRLRAGDSVLLSGTIYTARDMSHKRLCEALARHKRLPLSLRGQVIYYCGPTPAPKGRPIGSCGPTTASRMDEFTPCLLDAGLKGMIGKGPRGRAVIESIKKNEAIYFIAIGGIGALLAKHVRAASVFAYAELGAEAIYKLEVEDFPLIVGIDSKGESV